jgi:transcriptional regulator with XRE-family HTH domain
MRSTTQNGFARRVRELRAHKKLSQTELGNLVGLHYTHVSRYERGVARPSADTLKKLAEVFGVSTDYLLDGSAHEAAESVVEDRELLRQFQEIDKLSPEDRAVVRKVIDAFLIKKQLQDLAAR